MKTIRAVCLASLLLVTTASGQDRLQRIGGFTGGVRPDPEQMKQEAARARANAVADARRQPNLAQPFFEFPIVDPYRKVGGVPVSLVPMSNWIATGMVRWSAYQPFAVTNPVPGWTIVEGRVFSLRKDAIILSRDAEFFALLNWPGSESAVMDQSVRVLAMPAGRYASGDAAYPAFDYGTSPTAEERAVLEKRDSAEAAARAEAAAKLPAAAADADAKKKAEIADRVAKFRAKAGLPPVPPAGK